MPRLISHPILCNYYLTYRCNASCNFCDIWEKPSPYVTLEAAAQNFKDLKKLGVKVIDFTGGEPLLHQQLPELLALAKSNHFITTVTSNGLLYPKMAQKLQGKIDMLHFSLDAANKEVHDQGRGVACFDFVMESIQIAKSLGERPDIIFTVFDHNLAEIAPLYHTICRPNNLVLILNPVFEYNGVASSTQLSDQQLNELLAWGKKTGVYLNEAFILLRKNGGNNISKPVCKAASTTIVISPENKLILPCYHLGLTEFDINNQLYQLYQSEPIKALIAMEGRHQKCEGCTINCYMQPSFAVELNQYFFKALPSTLKYNYMKGTWKKLFR
jgi:MoaA/NifB/PqqE/SkfB family radical SAM enzyme